MPAKPTEFYSKTRYARKIIVVAPGFLGDSIHLTPSLWEIKRNYPQAELHVASTPLGCELLAMVPCVNRLWPLARTPQGTPLREQWQWIGNVRREKFDVAFNLSGADRSVFLTFLTGARYRVAFAGGRDHFWNAWLIAHWVPRGNRQMHVSEQQRQVLAACGLTLASARYDLRIAPEGVSWAEQNIPANAVHLSINASHFLKEWPQERWISLAEVLLREHPDLCLVATGTASLRERGRLEKLAAALANPRLRVFAGGVTLAQLAALLKRCSLHVGADSGALHLAAVLGVPTVSLFRDHAGLSEWLPRGERHDHVVTPCRCVDQKVQPCLEVNRAQCLAEVSAERVLPLIRRQLGLTACGKR